MKIGAISELNNANITFKELSSSSNKNKYLIEISKQNNIDTTKYDSIQYDLNQCMSAIGSFLDSLLELINALDRRITTIAGSYLPLAGGTLTGPLIIGTNDNKVTNPLTIFANADDITKNYAIKTIGAKAINFADDVKIDGSGILNCKHDIDGCALAAKWS